MRSYKKRRVGRIKKRKTKRRQKLRIKGGFYPEGLHYLNDYIDSTISNDHTKEELKKLTRFYFNLQNDYKHLKTEEEKNNFSSIKLIPLMDKITSITNNLPEDVQRDIWDNIRYILQENKLLD